MERLFEFNPPVIAHRGASQLAPENTISAFYCAKQAGAQWVEFDVMLAKCGEAVVIHDQTVDRTTNGKGKVNLLTYQELQKLDAGSWFDGKFHNERIPTLADTLLAIQEYGLCPNIEIKPFKGFEEQTIKKIVAVLKKTWDKHSPPPLLSSFSVKALEYMRIANPKAHLALLLHGWNKEWQKICDKYNCEIVSLNNKILTVERINKIQATNRQVLSYTINNIKRAQQLFDLGVDAIFSDVPDKIICM